MREGRQNGSILWAFSSLAAASHVFVHDVLVRRGVEHLLPRGELCRLADPGVHLFLGQGFKVALVFNLEAAALQEFLERAEARVLAHEGGVEDLVKVDELRHGLMRQLVESCDLDGHKNIS